VASEAASAEASAASPAGSSGDSFERERTAAAGIRSGEGQVVPFRSFLAFLGGLESSRSGCAFCSGLAHLFPRARFNAFALFVNVGVKSRFHFFPFS